MTTITRFTKEQLIAKLQHQLTVTAKFPGVEEAELDAAIFQIALASLEAEPIGFAFSDDVALMRKKIKVGGMLTARHQGEVALYAAPPAPVVPDECPEEIRELMASHSDALFNDDDAQEIWNACRAAMLQSHPCCLDNR